MIEPIRFRSEEFAKLKRYLMIFECGRLTLLNKLNIIHEGFKAFQEYDPIGHIESRLKAFESIAEKLHRLGLEITADNARKELFDIAGVRIVCNFVTDIPMLLNIIQEIPDLDIIRTKDYVTYPKPSGYRGCHLIIDVPVVFHSKVEIIPVELQIRTEAMNFWASLEHKMKYKHGGVVPDHLKEALVRCAENTSQIDDQMLLIHREVELCNGNGH